MVFYLETRRNRDKLDLLLQKWVHLDISFFILGFYYLGVELSRFFIVSRVFFEIRYHEYHISMEINPHKVQIDMHLYNLPIWKMPVVLFIRCRENELGRTKFQRVMLVRSKHKFYGFMVSRDSLLIKLIIDVFLNNLDQCDHWNWIKSNPSCWLRLQIYHQHIQHTLNSKKRAKS